MFYRVLRKGLGRGIYFFIVIFDGCEVISYGLVVDFVFFGEFVIYGSIDIVGYGKEDGVKGY